MRTILRIGSVALAAWLVIGCSTEPTTQDSSVQAFSAENLVLIAPQGVAAKASATDEVDFELALQPNRNANYNTSEFKIKVDRGSVQEDVTIDGDWLGDNTPGYFGIDFGPDGFEFEQPIEVWIRIPAWVFEQYDADRLCFVLDREDGSYELVDSHWNFRGGSYWMTSDIEHFSKYLVAVGPPPDNNLR